MDCSLPCGPDLPICHAHETPKPRDMQTMPGAGHRGDQEEVHVQEQAARHHHQVRAPSEEAMSITYQNAACHYATPRRLVLNVQLGTLLARLAATYKG